MGNLEHVSCQRLQGTVNHVKTRVVRQAVELVALGSQLQTICLAELFSDLFRHAFSGVQASTNSRTTNCQFFQRWFELFNVLQVMFKRSHIARDFLAKSQWNGILQVSPANLNRFPVLVLLDLQFVNQVLYGWLQLIQGFQGYDVHCRWERVV